jgi:Ca2+-binding EF-hand superfamily protein
MLSRAEADKGMPRLTRHFDLIDTNKDGQLSRDELSAAGKAHQGAKGPAKP